MSKNYAEISRAIVLALGGAENIEAVTHCMTRLRFVVKDTNQVDSAVAFKTKNPELRQTALAAAASAIVAGISEPALYGVAVRLKRPLIASLISGFICGAVAGIGGLASHSMASPGLFTSVQFFDPNNPMSIVWVGAVMALSVVLSFVLTLVLGFEDIPIAESSPKTPAAAVDAAKPVNAN